MKLRVALIAGLILLTALAVYSLTEKTHSFSKDDCAACHVDPIKDLSKLKNMGSDKCTGCHSDVEKKQSHPVDFVSTRHIPEDMPLAKGMVTCITCHYAHPFSVSTGGGSYYMLRRPGRGEVFCSTCHKVDEKGHILFDKVHMGSYKELDRGSPIDMQSLQCIECHDSFLDKPVRSLGAGTWSHFDRRKNHPIGISYGDAFARKPRGFNPPGMLPKEVRLINGKIGCGTCHSSYSKEKYMLVMSNIKSRLCLVCHNL
jgi:predicted CXXCH cytochrome family protein